MEKEYKCLHCNTVKAIRFMKYNKSQNDYLFCRKCISSINSDKRLINTKKKIQEIEIRKKEQIELQHFKRLQEAKFLKEITKKKKKKLQVLNIKNVQLKEIQAFILKKAKVF